MYDKAFDVIFIQFEKSVGKKWKYVTLYLFVTLNREFLKLPRQTYYLTYRCS